MTAKNLQYESGRSMVEMLGTLAIIGVLSVGGIAGYSYGMDKYKANQTINDIMLMGVDIITQTSRGAVPTLSEWGTKTTVGYDFTVVPNPSDDTQYGIQISGVPARVCKMVGDALKPMASVYVNDDEHITEEDPCDESDNNTMEFYFATGAVETDGCKTDTDCGDGRYCDIDTRICFRGDRPAGTYGKVCTDDSDCGICGGTCYMGTCNMDQKNGTNCSTDAISNGICYWGECLSQGCTYDKNNCKDTEYCSSSSSDCETEAFPNGAIGKCQTPDYVKYDIDGKAYYISYHSMNWWDADASCKALGKKLGKTMSLVNVYELVIGGWNGESGKITLTPLAEQLFEKAWERVGEPSFWTINTKSTCAYEVDLGQEYVFCSCLGGEYHRYGTFALCH